MDSRLLIKLVEAHYQGEASFQQAVRAMTEDADANGNADLAQRLREASKAEDVFDFAPSSAQLALLPQESPGPSKKDVRRPSPLTGKKPRVVGSSMEPPHVGQRGQRNDSAFMPSDMFASRSSLAIPKDRDSALDLYEILRPSIGLDALELPPKQADALRAVVKEWRQATNLRKRGLCPTQKVLLCGPPGVGKTTAAHALASEMGLPMAYVRLDSLVSSYLGQTSTNLRRIFDSLGDQPIVLFLDEFDAIAKKRDDNQEVGELKRIVITLLQNFDNVSPNVFIFAATNHPHLLDPAIWRRFDLAVQLELPAREQREAILRKAIPAELSTTVDFELLSHATAGLSGSQILDIANRALKRAAMSGTFSLNTDAALDAVIEYHTRFHIDDDAEMRITEHLKSLKVGWREIAGVLRTPVSTLRDRWQKYEKEKKGEG